MLFLVEFGEKIYKISADLILLKNTYRFARSLAPYTIRPFHQPQKRMFNCRVLSFIALLTTLDESYVTTGIHTHTNVYESGILREIDMKIGYCEINDSIENIHLKNDDENNRFLYDKWCQQTY